MSRGRNRLRWLLIFLLLSTVAIAQQRMEGTIVDKETGKPVPFASIVIVGTPKGTSTNLNGQFSVLIEEPFSIKVTCLGYETLVVNGLSQNAVIQLKPIATQLAEVYVFNKAVNPNKIVRRAFASIADNYNSQSFLQKFFYRHYSKTDSVYERLIEACADVWKHNGYRSTRGTAGEKEEMRITQLRRSLDITGMVQAQRPLRLGYILQSDIVGYQTNAENTAASVFEEASNLKTNFADYIFTFDGITNYDGQEVYKINYVQKKDSVLTTSGYKMLPQASGSLFIATDNFAFVKTEDTKEDEFNTIHTTAFYRKYGEKYYPYHFVREGENRFIDHKINSFHIELISLEVSHGGSDYFTGREPGRNDLLKIPYDSSFWSTTSILKATPLEDDIIKSLGGGISLNKQFYLYRQYEMNVTDGGNNGDIKFNWLKDDSKHKRMLYVCFWDDLFRSYIIELEYMKQLNQLFKNHITFVMISLEDDEAKWQQLITNYNFFSDGIVNYRIGDRSQVLKDLGVKNIPAFILISRHGEIDTQVKSPKDPMLKADLKSIIEQLND